MATYCVVLTTPAATEAWKNLKYPIRINLSKGKANEVAKRIIKKMKLKDNEGSGQVFVKPMKNV